MCANGGVGKPSVPDLLGAYADILEELKRRGAVRSSNNPVGDYAETLFCRCFGWRREQASSAGYDAVDHDGRRMQIKSRRMTDKAGSRQLSALRKLNQDPFDTLAGVLFDTRFKVFKAALIPIAIVHDGARYNNHTNSWLFLLDDKIWHAAGVLDVTAALDATASVLDET